MSETAKEDPGTPPDPYRLVYIIFYWLGVGTLLPWNFFISVPGKQGRPEMCWKPINIPWLEARIV